MIFHVKEVKAHIKYQLGTCLEAHEPNPDPPNISNQLASRFACFSSIIGLVVEFVVAIDEARVRFTDDAQ